MDPYAVTPRDLLSALIRAKVCLGLPARIPMDLRLPIAEVLEKKTEYSICTGDSKCLQSWSIGRGIQGRSRKNGGNNMNNNTAKQNH
jgi:hypothetical protein